MLANFEQLQKLVDPSLRRHVVVAAANDVHSLEAVMQAAAAGILDYTLVAEPEKAEQAAAQCGQKLNRHKLLPAYSEKEAAAIAVAQIRAGRGNVLMKGLLHSNTFLRAVLNRQSGIRGTGLLCHAALLDTPAYPKLLCVIDGGMVPYPQLAEKAEILRHASTLFHALGYARPKAAILAAAETISPEIPESIDAQKLKAIDFPGLEVDGPLSLDLAISPEACRVKGYQSDVAGNADILLVPNLAAGNLMGKAIVFFGHARMAGCVLGAQVPIVLTSRAAKSEEKYFSLLLAAILCQHEMGLEQ